MLEGAAQHLFTFLRYSGMPSHNNAAELGTRDPVVLHRNVRHRLSEPKGMEVFPVSVSVARACHKWGMFPRVAVESPARDPGRSVFRPPEQEPKERELPAAAAR